MIEREFTRNISKTAGYEAINFGTCCWAWGALYRTDFLKKNQIFFFEEIKFSEDILFQCKSDFMYTKIFTIKKKPEFIITGIIQILFRNHFEREDGNRVRK